MSKPRSAVFTSFDLTRIYEWVLSKPIEVRYLTWNVEIAPETGREHLQGYVEFFRPHRLNAIKQILGDDSMHIEPRRGTRDEARAYAQKEDTRHPDWETFYEIGEWIAGQGQRFDLEVVKKDLDSGKTDKEIAQDHFPTWVKFNRSFDRYRQVRVDPRDPNVTPDVSVFVGPPESGKSRAAFNENPGAYYFMRPQRNGGSIWFDGYTGQSTIILEEFYGWLPFDFLLRLIDRYPMRVETKGGSVEMAATKFVFTTNTEPDQWYRVTNLQALKRRISSIRRFSLEPQPTEDRLDTQDDDDVVFVSETPPQPQVKDNNDNEVRVPEDHSQESNDAYALETMDPYYVL